LVGIAMEIGERMLSRPDMKPEEAAKFATTLALHGFHALPVKG